MSDHYPYNRELSRKGNTKISYSFQIEQHLLSTVPQTATQYRSIDYAMRRIFLDDWESKNLQPTTEIDFMRHSMFLFDVTRWVAKRCWDPDNVVSVNLDMVDHALERIFYVIDRNYSAQLHSALSATVEGLYLTMLDCDRDLIWKFIQDLSDNHILGLKTRSNEEFQSLGIDTNKYWHGTTSLALHNLLQHHVLVSTDRSAGRQAINIEERRGFGDELHWVSHRMDWHMRVSECAFRDVGVRIPAGDMYAGVTLTCDLSPNAKLKVSYTDLDTHTIVEKELRLTQIFRLTPQQVEKGVLFNIVEDPDDGA